MKPVITYSRLRTWQTCPQKEYLSYTAGGFGIVPTKPFLPFVEGEFGHYAIAYFRKNGRMLVSNMTKRIKRVMDEAIPVSGLSVEEVDKMEKALHLMVGACHGYALAYREDMKKRRWEGIEIPFEVDLGNCLLRGKIDAVEKTKAGLVVWENKFVSRFSNDDYEALPLDMQDILYCVGCEALFGKQPVGVQRDYVIKPMYKEKEKESRNEFYERVAKSFVEEKDKRLFRPPEKQVPARVIASVLESVKAQANTIGVVKPVPYLTACLGNFGQLCSYFPACKAKLEGHGDGWDSAACAGLFKAKQEQHPELKQKEIPTDDSETEEAGSK